jgi:hypothetical protein
MKPAGKWFKLEAVAGADGENAQRFKLAQPKLGLRKC